jgi:hypothetical protein
VRDSVLRATKNQLRDQSNQLDSGELSPNSRERERQEASGLSRSGFKIVVSALGTTCVEVRAVISTVAALVFYMDISLAPDGAIVGDN